MQSVYALALTALKRSDSWFYIIGSILIIFIMRQVVQRFNFVRSIEWIPGPPGFPLVGNALSLTGSQEEFYRLLIQYSKEFGPLFRLWVGTRPFVFIGKATDIQPILNSRTHIDKSYEYTFLKEWLGEGLLTSSGQKWQNRRKLLTPSFHNSVIEDNAALVLEQAKILVENLSLRVNESAFDVMPFLKLCALDLICATAMGIKIDAQRNGSQEYVRAVNQMAMVLQRRFITPWIKPDFIFKRTIWGRMHDESNAVIKKFVNGVIKSRRNEYLRTESEHSTDKSPKKKAFLDLLLNVENCDGSITSDEIAEEVNTFMFAGHDSTSTALSWCLYVFGKHPEVQTRIIEEYQTAFTHSDQEDYKKKVANLVYMDKCIKEALRLYPVVPLIARDIKESVQLDKYREIPPGTTVLIHSGILNRDPAYFPEPQKFEPERFSAENVNKRHPYSYIPFSAGPRNCIGQRFAQMSIKIIVGEILSKFEVTSIDDEKDLNLLSDIVLLNRQGIRISLKNRV